MTGADGQVLAQVETGTASSLTEANERHVTQRGRYVEGVLTGDDYNSAPEWDGYNDCGPTSVVIAASLVGELAPPTAEGAHAAIENARDLAFGEDTSSSRLTGVNQLATSLRGLGATGTVHAPASMDAIDAALAAGNPVIAGGYPFNSGAWGGSTADYLESGEKNFAHWVVVSGTTPEGNYLINDPLSPNGAIEITREQLVAYLDEGMGMLEVCPTSLPDAS